RFILDRAPIFVACLHDESERHRADLKSRDPLTHRVASHHSPLGVDAPAEMPSFASSYAAAICRWTSCSLAGSTPASARMSRITATGWISVMPHLAAEGRTC